MEEKDQNGKRIPQSLEELEDFLVHATNEEINAEYQKLGIVGDVKIIQKVTELIDALDELPEKQLKPTLASVMVLLMVGSKLSPEAKAEVAVKFPLALSSCLDVIVAREKWQQFQKENK